MSKISAVINTYNEEKNISISINSVKDWVDEIIVCDMYSTDKTVELAKKLGAKVVYHKLTHFVEPARNFAISKATKDWILVLDADEEIPDHLAKRLIELTNQSEVDHIWINRKNIVFGKWMKATMWWPDYHIRFFKKGAVLWSNKIHSKPEVKGEGLKLEETEELAIIHHHYDSVSQFIERMNRYTTIQAVELHSDGIKFNWQDLLSKPISEFLSRYFAKRGFDDGLHGLSLSMLQAISQFVLYLKLWDLGKFDQEEISLNEVKQLSEVIGKDLNYWFKYANLSNNPVKRFIQKARNKF